jgi:hypothetical protein
MSAMRSLVLVLVAIACSSSSNSGKPLDAAHLPAEVHGILPGTTTEQQAIAALPGAKVVRDRSFGGDHRVEVDEVPGISMEDTAGMKVWLARVDGELRVVMVEAPLVGDCTPVLAKMHELATDGPCKASNRKPDPGEHQMCARTADGSNPLKIYCYDKKSVKLRLPLSSSTESYMIAQ